MFDATAGFEGCPFLDLSAVLIAAVSIRISIFD
jgi:hypothetical protein